MQRIGGYPRVWRKDRVLFEGSQLIPDDQVAEYEAGWRAVHCRVEWMTSRRGRLDHLLPQTLPRIVHNANVRSWRERRSRSNRAQNGE